MDQKELIALKNKATELRIRAVDMIWKAQSGHPGGSLSVAEFVTACYFRYMKVDPKNPRWADRDRFVLSKGHVCPAQYAALAMKGFFPMEVLDTLRKEGSPLQGHPSMNKCPGIDISTGSLGQGLACAVGMALAAKLDGKDYRVFSAVGDGECNEGEIWEACGTAHKYKLDNLYRGFFVGVFLTVCFGARFLIEFIKEPQVEFEESMVLNMGQLLSIPFILLGIGFIVYAYVKKIPARAVHPESVKPKKEATHYAKSLTK